MQRLSSIVFTALLLLGPPSTNAQTSPLTNGKEPPEEIPTLDTVVVSGVASGPGLWRVDGPDGHVLWILGTLSPVPASIAWDASRVQRVVQSSQEILWEPYYTVDVKSGFLRKLTLGYGLYRAERNPDGKSLRDMLSPATYTRWTRAKARFGLRERGVEDKRPLVAADALLNAAIAKSGLSTKKVVNLPIQESAKSSGVKSTAPRVTVEVSAATAKAALAEIRSEALSDQACMEATLDAVESDLPRMITNANAWASGELDRINFRQLERRHEVCTDALTNAEFARRHGLPNIRQSIRARWIEEAQGALQRNRSTLAIASLENILGPQGYAAALRAQGYNVQDP